MRHLDHDHKAVAVKLEFFIAMQTDIVTSSKVQGSDATADAYYLALEILKLNGVNFIETKAIEDFK